MFKLDKYKIKARIILFKTRFYCLKSRKFLYFVSLDPEKSILK